jgi:voltage-gated potassium channel
METIGRLRIAVAAILGVLMVGTAGYMAFGWPFLDAFYMTVITVTTIGFREIRDPGTGEIVYTIVLAISGVGTVLFALSAVVEATVAGVFAGMFGRQRLQKRIESLRDHLIIAGYGRMGQLVVRELQEQPVPFVVVEREPEGVRQLERDQLLFVDGDATDDDTLRQAGIARARALVAVVSTDADNVFIVLTARELNPDLEIIARCTDERAGRKLLRAGATRVIAPYQIGGSRIAQAILQPNVVDFIEIATRRGRMEVFMEEARLRHGSSLVGKSLGESDLRRGHGVIIIAIKHPSGDMRFNPDPEEPLAEGDVMIAVGKRDGLLALEALARGA